MIDLSHLAAGSLVAGGMNAAGPGADDVPAAAMSAPGTAPVASPGTQDLGTSDTRPVGTPPGRVTG
jgi:hypothetical protein